ncbi:hypothetical protein IPZ61_15925 [Streptomyces sioyaensis]|uniref:hypothetical protein n=1 Tax=Streptomyces sioyaensis TaxID=67364 RepID=UPI001F288D4F|nr:hypothetical protein [Streptomyces sioyaensis]MCF3174800.1 hypothetical protein [Streptomyces sioyaensis]
MDTKTCTKCGKEKPLDAFHGITEKGGKNSWCAVCKNERMREHRASLGPQVIADKSRKYRAGMRVNKCAICGTSIKEREGICVTCEECVEVLGGLDGLKRAVRAVRYLGGK